MRMLCSICGQSGEVVQLSPDYEVADHRTFVNRARIVQFIYNSDPVDRFILSPEFMAAHGIVQDRLALPDDYPKWVKLLKVECRSCFESRGAK